LVLLLPRPATSTLFPYTTLFRSNPCFALGTRAWLRTRRRHVDAGCGVGSVVADLRRRTGRSRPDDDVVIKVIIILVVKINLGAADRKSTRLNSSHVKISYAVFCL